jgi:hypothetical protein
MPFMFNPCQPCCEPPTPPSTCEYQFCVGVNYSPSVGDLHVYIEDVDTSIVYHGYLDTNNDTTSTGPFIFFYGSGTVLLCANFTDTKNFRVWINQPTNTYSNNSTFYQGVMFVMVTRVGADLIYFNGEPVSTTKTLQTTTSPYFMPYAGYNDGIVTAYTGGVNIQVSCDDSDSWRCSTSLPPGYLLTENEVGDVYWGTTRMLSLLVYACPADTVTELPHPAIFTQDSSITTGEQAYRYDAASRIYRILLSRSGSFGSYTYHYYWAWSNYSTPTLLNRLNSSYPFNSGTTLVVPFFLEWTGPSSFLPANCTRLYAFCADSKRYGSYFTGATYGCCSGGNASRPWLYVANVIFSSGISYWQNKSFAVSQKLDSSSSQRGKFNFFTSGGPSTGTGTILWTLECTSGGVWTLIATNTSLSTTYGTGIYLTHLCSAPDTIAFSIDIGYGTVWEASILWFFKTL